MLFQALDVMFKGLCFKPFHGLGPLTSVDHGERHEVAHRGKVEGEEVDLIQTKSTRNGLENHHFRGVSHPFAALSGLLRCLSAARVAVGSTMALSVRSLERQTPMLPPLILYKKVLAALKETCGAPERGFGARISCERAAFRLRSSYFSQSNRRSSNRRSFIASDHTSISA